MLALKKFSNSSPFFPDFGGLQQLATMHASV
jgi:hypothetical protein